MAYTVIKDFIKDKEYIQTDFNKHLGKVHNGRLYYRGKSKNDYVFEDLSGNLFTITEKELEANPMAGNTATIAKTREYLSQKRGEKYGGKYKHDPFELIRMAHAYKYGVKPNLNSIYSIETEETDNILGYRANVQKQDCVLLIAKKPNGKPDYTKYDYGMSFSKGVDPEQIEVGTKYYVDNKPMRCTNTTRTEVEFTNIRGKKEPVWYSKDHIDAFHNVQLAKREQGEMEEKNPIREVQDNEEIVRQMIAEEVEDTSYAEDRKPVSKAQMSLYTNAQEKANIATMEAMNAYAGISGRNNPNKVSHRKLVKGEKYLTPYGHRTYEAGFTSKGMSKEQTRDMYFKIVSTGDYYSAEQFYTHHNQVYKFNLGNIVFTMTDLSNGIILKPLEKGKKYHTPDGVATYEGQTVKTEDLIKETKKLFEESVSRHADLEQIGRMIEKGTTIAKMRPILAGYATAYRDAIAQLLQREVYSFDGHKYSFMAILSGYVYEVEQEKAFKAEQRKADAKRIEESAKRQTAVKPEAEQNTKKDNTSLKVSYKRLRIGEVYTTPYGDCQYVNKKVIKGKTTYLFNTTFNTQITFTAKDIENGCVWEQVVLGQDYYYKDKLCKYAGFEMYNQNTVAFTFVDKETNEPYRCTYKMFVNGKVRKVKGGK